MSLSNEIDLEELNNLEKDLIRKSSEMHYRLTKLGLVSIRDVRYTTFSTLSSIIRSVKIYFIIRGENLLNNDWWQNLFANSYKSFMTWVILSPENNKTIANDFDQFINTSLFMSFYSITESRMRILYDIMLSNQYTGRIETSSISEIFQKITLKLQLSDEEINAFELLRTVRNTHHNNGVHTKPTKTIKYRNMNIQLIQNQTPNFGNSMNLLIQYIIPDIISILFKCIDRTWSIKNEITDPFLNEYEAITFVTSPR